MQQTYITEIRTTIERPITVKPDYLSRIVPLRPLISNDLKEAISVIGDFSAKGLFSVDAPSRAFPEAYIHLATACRNAMAEVLTCDRSQIHCTIKYFAASTKDKPEYRAKLWTFARSYEGSGRPMILGPAKKISLHRNSAFASIMGIPDKNNVWETWPHLCFSCNNLTEVPKYVDSKKNWSSFYKSSVVFPLRYTKGAKQLTDCILGFLTFDSPLTNVFHGVPSRFDYVGRPDEYMKDFMKTDLYHVGSTLADSITMALLAGKRTEAERDEEKEIETLEVQVKQLRELLNDEKSGIKLMRFSFLWAMIFFSLFLITKFTPLMLIHPVISILGFIGCVGFYCIGLIKGKL